VAIPSIFGDFVVELHTEIDARPTPAMVDRANALVRQFQIDAANLSDMIYSQYLAVCDDPDWREWLADAGVAAGLSISEIGRYLKVKTLVVFDDLSASVYVSPDWDTEHGLYYDWTGEGWTEAE
jgi:hypothetical protein